MIIRASLFTCGLVTAMLAGCVSSSPGVVHTSQGNPIVTIGAGVAEIGDGGWRVWYVIDRKTQTCWLKLGDSGAAMSCCAIRRVEEAVQHITWETDASCAKPTPPTPAPADTQPSA